MRKKNSLAVAGIVLLLALGYSIPSVVMAIEDDGRKSELKSFAIEEIQLSFQNVNIEEEMGIFPDMLLNNIVVEMGDTSIKVQADEDSQGTQENTQEELEDKEYIKIENSIDAFLDVLQPEYTIEFVDFKATYYVLMVSQEDERVYPILECYGIDKEKREYRFWLDDISGTVLAFEIPYEVIGVSDEELYMALERMGKYYGYEVYSLAEYLSDVYKIASWQNALMLFDEEKNTQNTVYIFKVGERLLFNVYPGSVTIYGGTYSETE